MLRVQQATGDAKFGNQNTDGSRSIRTLLKPMRKMGAMARSILRTSSCKKMEHSLLKIVKQKIIL